MTITETVKQGLHYARTCRSLWLFGFFAGLANGGSGGVGNSHRGAGSGVAAGGAGLFGLPMTAILVLVAAIVLAAVAAFVMRFVSEGALIEGIVRARRNGTMTTGEGFRAGWAHWGVLFRIALLYFAVTFVSLALLVVPCAIAFWRAGPIAGIALAIPALFIAVPWIVTVYLVQAFGSRIAVLENRQAFDAIRKARLFLHGRLRHGLKLIVASLAGMVVIVFIGLAAIVPVVLVLAALIPLVGLAPILVVGCVLVLPAAFVLIAMSGTLRSSIWTIGYLTQVEA